VAGQPVFLPRLVLGVALTFFLAVLNYRGIPPGAPVFQKLDDGNRAPSLRHSLGVSADRGTLPIFIRRFARLPSVSILLTLQIVPYFMTGFESVPKVRRKPIRDSFDRIFSRDHDGASRWVRGFYVLAGRAVAYVAPWRG